MRPKAIFSTLLLLAAASSAGACSQASEEDETTEGALEQNASSRPFDALPILSSESPSGGNTFTFCSRPAPPTAEAPLNLTNAAWLAMASANEYAHLGYFAPQLLDMGFGTAADSLWTQCARDLGRMRDFELAHQEDLSVTKSAGGAARLVATMRHPDVDNAENFGVCAREFIENHYRGVDEAGELQLPAAAFKDYLLRKTDDTNWIQFFSAKPYSFLERRMGKGSTQAFIARHGTKPVVILAFRGTEAPNKENLQVREVIDVLKDLDIYKTELTDYGFSNGWGYAHRGFVTALQAVDDTDRNNLLVEKIKTLTRDDPNVTVWVTGHSLGGAIATLMTARLLDLLDQGATFKLGGMYTFGSPMVGNHTFKARMEESARRHGVTLARFRNDQDVVTSVPGVLRLLNYHHAGQLALLTPSGLTMPNDNPAYGTKTLDDHDSAGITGAPGSRQLKSGYYSRIVDQLRRGAAPALTACAD